MVHALGRRRTEERVASQSVFCCCNEAPEVGCLIKQVDLAHDSGGWRAPCCIAAR